MGQAKHYQVIMHHEAATEMTDLVGYIRNSLLNKAAATEQSKYFMQAIASLHNNALRCPRWAVMRDGTVIRRLYVKNYVLIYSVQKNYVHILHAFYARQDYKNRI